MFAKRELAGSLHTRWFLVYSAVFLAGGLLLATFGIGSTVVYGYRGFAKSFAGLVHLALVFVPLMALFPAAATIAEERESGVLEYILAQPVTFVEVYLGKWAGISIAVVLSLTVGFGAAGAVAVLGHRQHVMRMFQIEGWVMVHGRNGVVAFEKRADLPGATTVEHAN